MDYTANHRIFLLNLYENGLLEEATALQLYRDIFEDDNATLNKMNNAIELINEKIRPIKQQINHFTSEQLKCEYIVFVNTDSSELMRYQAEYSEAEIQLLRSLLCEIAKERDHSTTSISALNMTASIKVTKVHSQELIYKWIEEGIFAEVDDRLYLGPRGIVEFGPYLRVNFPDEVGACILCKEPIFTGLECPECDALLHQKCLSKYLAKVSKCPSCKKRWSVPL